MTASLIFFAGDANATNDISVLHIDQLLGVNELNKNIGLTVIPNPSGGLFHIQVQGVTGKVTITVCDLQGRTVLNEKAIINSSYDKNIDLLSEPRGMYFLRVETEKGMRVEKICVE
ncbi:MAG: T9SS type A sorting domain-containing protein [Bacteroidetes bacterium]|nr:T9SS type A sorting domain-containing protein [Bacteroidota bacterium]